MKRISDKEIQKLWEEYIKEHYDEDKVNCGIDLEEFDGLIGQKQLKVNKGWLLERTKRERYIPELQIYKLEVWLTPEEYKEIGGVDEKQRT
jgi:hypothetical protein